jgi:hypothetical protein
MNSVNTATTPAPLVAESPARNLALAALALCFVALFFTYQVGEVPIQTPGPYVTYTRHEAVRHTGFVEKPYAIYIIIGLFMAFVTSLRHGSFWRSYGYWLSLVLLVCFALLNGYLSGAGILLAGWAALLNRKALKLQPLSQ